MDLVRLIFEWFKHVSNSWERVLALVGAVFLLGVCLAFISEAGNVIVQGGTLNVTDYFWAGGTAFYVDSVLSRVGINTFSPTQVLDVNGSINSSATVYANNYSSAGSQIIFINATNGAILLSIGEAGNVTLLGDLSFGCPDDMVKVGDFCIDRYEASVWTGPGGTGTQAGNGSDTYDSLCGGGDNATGFNCYAASVYNVTPSVYITWFQADAACANAGKHLCSNREWQTAARGTPDNASCVLWWVDNDLADDLPAGAVPGNCYDYGDNDQSCAKAGTAVGCISDYGVYDMAGNVAEWVGDWGQAGQTWQTDNGSSAYPWPSGYGDDRTVNVNGVTYDGSTYKSGLPAAAHRGGLWYYGNDGGIFALHLGSNPAATGSGFRCCK